MSPGVMLCGGHQEAASGRGGGVWDRPGPHVTRCRRVVPPDVGACPVSRMTKLRPREVEPLARGPRPDGGRAGLRVPVCPEPQRVTSPSPAPSRGGRPRGTFHTPRTFPDFAGVVPRFSASGHDRETEAPGVNRDWSLWTRPRVAATPDGHPELSSCSRPTGSPCAWRGRSAVTLLGVFL